MVEERRANEKEFTASGLPLRQERDLLPLKSSLLSISLYCFVLALVKYIKLPSEIPWDLPFSICIREKALLIETDRTACFAYGGG